MDKFDKMNKFSRTYNKTVKNRAFPVKIQHEFNSV